MSNLHARRWVGAARRPAVEPLEDRLSPAVFTPAPATADGAAGSLRANVITANTNTENNLFVLSAGTYRLTLANLAGQENAAQQGDLDLTAAGRTFTFRGAGADQTVIDAAGLDRAFQLLPGVTAVFENLTIVGGVAVDDGTDGALPGATVAQGGAILSGGTLALFNVKLQNNVARGADGVDGGSSVAGTAGQSARGGAVSSSGDTTLDGVTLTLNQAVAGRGGDGGPGNTGGPGADGGNAGSAQGGAVFSTAALIVRNATFTSNAALGGRGGNGGDGNFGSGEVGGAGGQAGSGEGGAIFGTGSTTVDGSTFTGNRAAGGAGGRSGETAAAPSTGAAGAGGAGRGGAVHVGGSLVLTGSTVSGNTAAGGRGGNGGNGFYGNGAPVGDAGAGGAGEGGGVFVSGPATVAGSSFVGNQATGADGGNGGSSGEHAGAGGAGGNALGGAIHAGGRLGLTDTAVTGNTATGGNGGSGGDGNFSPGSPGGAGGDGGFGSGGGVYVLAGPGTLVRATVVNNQADSGLGGTGGFNTGGGNAAGGIVTPAVGGGVSVAGLVPVQVVDSLFAGNRASADTNDYGGLLTSTRSSFQAPPAAAGIAVRSGSGQTAIVRTGYVNALQVVVVDQFGNPVSGVSVTFRVALGFTGAGGTFAGPITVVSDANGIATAPPLTANAAAGGFSVIATATGVPGAATFPLTNAAAPAAIRVFSGSGQRAGVGGPYQAPLRVRVTNAAGRPVAGIPVTFAAPIAGPSVTFNGSPVAFTDANGVAAVSVTAGSLAGRATVRAYAPGVAAPATFALTNLAGLPTSITPIRGTPQAAVVGTAYATPFQVLLRDTFGNPVPNAVVTFAVGSGTGSGRFTLNRTIVSVTTNAAGVATAPVFRANSTVGTFTVVVTNSYVSQPAGFQLSNLPAPPATVQILQGNHGTAATNTVFSNVIAVTVKDAQGHLLEGVPVTFTVLPGPNGAGASFSGASTVTVATVPGGIGFVLSMQANGTPGAFKVRVSIAAPFRIVSVIFDLTVI